MTDAPAAFIGNYANIVTRKTRSVCVVEVELPIEQMQAFIAAFGAPLPGKEVPVALARLDPSKPASEPRKGNGGAVKERRKFYELPLSQQAAMRCSEIEFWEYLSSRWDKDISITSKESAAELVREWCGVKSRSGITDSDESGRRWRDLNRDFLNWKHAVPLGEPTR